MIKIYDDFFDKFWLDEVTNLLMLSPWYADNVANANLSYPYQRQGTHRFFGNKFFVRKSENEIEYNDNKNFSDSLIQAFDHIQFRVQRKMQLIEIVSNLQFMGMDGSIHVDGDKNQSAFILMLSNEHISKNIGGEFYYQPTDTKIEYKYGRVIEITASDPHCGLSFNIPHVARISVKWMGTNL